MGMCQKSVWANRGIPSIPNGTKFPRKGDDETHPCFIFEQLHIDTTANCVRNPILPMREPPSFRSGASPIFPCPWWASPRCRAYSHTSRFRGWWSGSCRAPRQELVGDPLLVCLFLRANTGISTRTPSKARYNESIQDATSWRLLALPMRSGELMETFKSPYPFLQPIPIWR